LNKNLAATGVISRGRSASTQQTDRGALQTEVLWSFCLMRARASIASNGQGLTPWPFFILKVNAPI